MAVGRRFAAVLMWLLLMAAPPLDAFAVRSQQQRRTYVSSRCRSVLKRRPVNGYSEEPYVASSSRSLHGTNGNNNNKRNLEVNELLDATNDAIDRAVGLVWSFLSRPLMVGIVQIRFLYPIVFGWVWLSTDFGTLAWYTSWFAVLSLLFRRRDRNNDASDLYGLVTALAALWRLPTLLSLMVLRGRELFWILILIGPCYRYVSLTWSASTKEGSFFRRGDDSVSEQDDDNDGSLSKDQID